MFGVRTPVSSTTTSQGGNTTNGHNVHGEQFNSGQRESKHPTCNKAHDVPFKLKTPSYYHDCGKITKSAPLSIIRSCEVLTDALLFRSMTPAQVNRLLFSEFNRYVEVMMLFTDVRLAKLFNHYDAEGKKLMRARRRDGVESLCTLMLNAIIFRTDLYTGIYGYRDKKQRVVCFNYKQLHKDTGLSKSQYYRCAKVLQNQGWLTIVPVTEELATGKVITTEVQIRVNPEIFNLLGQGEQYGKDRHYKMMEAHKGQARERIAHAQAMIMQQKNFVPRGVLPKKKKIQNVKELATSMTVNKKPVHTLTANQTMIEAALHMASTTGLSPSECLATLQAQYKPPPS